jgi:hypothetical protein
MFTRYEDSYVRDSGGRWKIERRDVRTDWTETHPMTEAPAAPGQSRPGYWTGSGRWSSAADRISGWPAPGGSRDDGLAPAADEAELGVS